MMRCRDHSTETCQRCQLLTDIEEGVWDRDLEYILEAAHARKRRLRDARKRHTV